jgi:pyridoxamine 5'-phosphate oxidase
MVLSTVDEQGHPDSRVVLLKGLDKGNFIFYTNYQSTKGMQIKCNPHAALNFYWPQSARQVRIKGKVEKITDKQSDEYFISRPVMSQLSAVISPQSQEIPDRAFLENALNDLVKTQDKEHVKRPGYWGGYQIIPDEIEFWQGRDNRLHDRIQYYRQDGSWFLRRLAP